MACNSYQYTLILTDFGFIADALYLHVSLINDAL